MRNRVVLVGIVGIALALASFAGPWWVVGFQSSSHFGPASGTSAYGPFGMVSVTQARWTPGGNQTNVSDYRYAPATGGVFLAATIASVAGVVLAAGMLLLVPLAGSGRRRASVVLGFAAGAATLAGILALVLFVPGAVNADTPALANVVPITGFWGSGSWSLLDFSTSLTWAAGWGWYPLLGAGILFPVAAFLRLREKTPAP